MRKKSVIFTCSLLLTSFLLQGCYAQAPRFSFDSVGVDTFETEDCYTNAEPISSEEVFSIANVSMGEVGDLVSTDSISIRNSRVNISSTDLTIILFDEANYKDVSFVFTFSDGSTDCIEEEYFVGATVYTYKFYHLAQELVSIGITATECKCSLSSMYEFDKKVYLASANTLEYRFTKQNVVIYNRNGEVIATEKLDFWGSVIIPTGAYYYRVIKEE